MRVDISPKAFEDLESIKKYIETQLRNSQASKTIITDILESIKSLDIFSNRGTPLNTLIAVKSDYRFIQSHNYAIFYRTEAKRVLVVRVLYKRRDFMKIFFNDENTAEHDD